MGPFAEARGRVSVELSLDGDLWASTERGLFHFLQEEWKLSHKFDRPMPVFDLASGHDGSMWALTPRSILQLADGDWRSVDMRRPTLDPRGGFRAIASRKAGGCWLGGGTGVYSFDRQTLKRLDVDIDGPARILFEQSDGTLWIGGFSELYRYRDGDLRHVD